MITSITEMQKEAIFIASARQMEEMDKRSLNDFKNIKKNKTNK